MNNKLVRVNGKPFVTFCLGCGVRMWAGEGYEAYADTTGKPFEAYYCSDNGCAPTRSLELDCINEGSTS